MAKYYSKKVTRDGMTFDSVKEYKKAVKYVADFVYTEDGRMIVEDVKSPATKTRDYIIKRKLMLWAKGITIKEV